MGSEIPVVAGGFRAEEERMDGLLALVEREVLGWPGVWKNTDRNGIGGVGVTGYRLGRRQIGHIHHDGVADLQFPRAIHDELVSSGRAEPHRGGFRAVVSYRIRVPEDVRGVVELFRMNYDRIRDAGTARG